MLQLNLQFFAHKKGVGSTKNGRDSESKRLGAKTLAVTNVVGSSIAREADQVMYTWAGPEIAVASTKAYTTQLVTMFMLAMYMSGLKGTITPERAHDLLTQLRHLPDQVGRTLEDVEPIKIFAKNYAYNNDVFYIGRSLDYYVALEGALKLKEISYIHAEAYAAGELKHGTLALIESDVPVIALATQKSVYEKTLSNIKEVKARDAVIIGIAFRMTLLSLLYYFIFVILRQFTGGYHADTYLKCNLIFAATTVFIFGMSKMAAIGDIYTIGFHLLILVFSIMVIWIKAPVENENKPLSEKQKIRNHWLSMITVIVLAVISGFLYKEAVLIAALIAFTLFVVAVMTVIATSKRKEE